MSEAVTDTYRVALHHQVHDTRRNADRVQGTVAVCRVAGALCKNIFTVLWPSFFSVASLQVWSPDVFVPLPPTQFAFSLSLFCILESPQVWNQRSYSSPWLHFICSTLLLGFLECQFQENLLGYPMLTSKYDHLPFLWANRMPNALFWSKCPEICQGEQDSICPDLAPAPGKTQLSGVHLCGYHSASCSWLPLKSSTRANIFFKQVQSLSNAPGVHMFTAL